MSGLWFAMSVVCPRALLNSGVAIPGTWRIVAATHFDRSPNDPQQYNLGDAPVA